MKRMAILLSVIICSIAVSQPLSEQEIKDQITLLAEIRLLKMGLQDKDKEITRLNQQLESEKRKVELYKSMYNNKRPSTKSSVTTIKMDKKTRKAMEKKREEYAQKMKEQSQRELARRQQSQSRTNNKLERLDYMKLDSYYNNYNPRYAGYPRTYYYPRYSRYSNGRYAHPESFYYGY